jgi:16S rRNA (cytosine1402-N4)-methyltransferase
MKDTNKQNDQNEHIPVLLDAVLQCLDPKPGEKYLDLTAGYGGHAESILERTLQPEKATLIDRDLRAIDYLSQQFQGTGTEIIHKDYLEAAKELLESGKQYNLILADLGVSSPHLNMASRGFSIRHNGPLDMRMDQRQSLTAEEVVNSYSEEELASLIRRYGEEPRATKIARAIAANRPITSTHQLAEIVARSAYGRKPGHSKIHPATRTFQAIRMEVNRELELLQEALPIWIDLLAPGGRIAVISFHSLEDRLVKRAFKERSGNRYDATLRLLTKRPVRGDKNEIVFNPRARSAKLRAAAKINNKKKGEP